LFFRVTSSFSRRLYIRFRVSSAVIQLFFCLFRFLVFMSLFIGKHGASTVIKCVDNLQANLFAMVLDSLYVPNVAKVNGRVERKICCIGMIKLLTECPETLSTYAAFWPKVLRALLTVIELPEDETEQHGEFAIDEDEEQEHTFTNAAFTPLTYASKQDVDPFSGVDVKKYLATQLYQLSTSQPTIQAHVRSLEPDVLKVLHTYYALAGLPAST